MLTNTLRQAKHCAQHVATIRQFFRKFIFLFVPFICGLLVQAKAITFMVNAITTNLCPIVVYKSISAIAQSQLDNVSSAHYVMLR